ncbi:MAG: hypothetical protein J5762_07370 [Clostridia bacterium]|nr:hypothetical protein [Clostridia bacterium]
MTEGTFAISSRIRLARNISGVPFPCVILDSELERKVVSVCEQAMKKLGGFSVSKMAELTDLEKRSLVERYLISPYLADGDGGAVAVSSDGAISVMINEEDHIREQIVMRGSCLKKAYSRLAALDNVLKINLNFASSGGVYYTACPSNLGTGMRASIMLFLPAISYYGESGELAAVARERGLVIRGAFGEGSAGESYLYQVSNEITYKITENDILSLVSEFVDEIADREESLRRQLFDERGTMFADECARSLGILKNCILLTYSEMSELISRVKLGIDMGVIFSSSPAELDDLLVAARSATLKLNSSFRMKDEAIIRAAFVRDYLEKSDLKVIF